MKPIDAIRLQLKAMELVEGTDLAWFSVLRCANTKIVCDFIPVFDSPYGYKLALGIIEGKPVWAGDLLWHSKYSIKQHYVSGINGGTWSWLPPTPKTAMVELPIESVEYWKRIGEFWDNESTANYRDEYMIKSMEFYAACRKTLSELK